MTETRKWTFGAVAVIVVLLMASWFLLISPKRSEAADLTAKTDEQISTNAELTTQIAVLKQQSKSLPKQEAKLAELQSRIPVDAQLPTLLVELNDVARKSGVAIVSLNPATPVTLGTAAAPGTALAPDQLAGINVTLQVEGGYFEVQQFVNALEGMQRAFLVAGLNIVESEGTSTASADTGTTGDTQPAGTLSATINGRVYMVPTAESMQAAAVIPGTATTTTTTAETPAPSTP